MFKPEEEDITKDQ